MDTKTIEELAIGLYERKKTLNAAKTQEEIQLASEFFQKYAKALNVVIEGNEEAKLLVKNILLKCEQEDGTSATSINEPSLHWASIAAYPKVNPPFPIQLGLTNKQIKSVFTIDSCQNVFDAAEKILAFSKEKNIAISPNFTLLYPIFMDLMNTEHESTMHMIAGIVLDESKIRNWKFDRTGGYTGKTERDFYEEIKDSKLAETQTNKNNATPKITEANVKAVSFRDNVSKNNADNINKKIELGMKFTKSEYTQLSQSERFQTSYSLEVLELNNMEIKMFLSVTKEAPTDEHYENSAEDWRGVILANTSSDKVQIELSVPYKRIIVLDLTNFTFD